MIETIVAAALATAGILTAVLPPLWLGLFIANIFSLYNFTLSGRLTGFFAGITGLHPACVLSVALSVGDRTAGMAAVAAARQKAGLSDGEVIAANLVAKAPSVLQFFAFSFIPVMVALYPWEEAARFLRLYFLAFALISLAGMVYARLVRRSRMDGGAGCDVPGTGPGWRGVTVALAATWRPFANMACWMAGMSFLAMALIKSGLLDGLPQYLPMLAALGLDANMVPLAGTGLISMMGGVAAVGAAVREGIVPVTVVTPLLFAISLLHNIYDLFAAALPRYIGIFGRRLGVKVSLVGFVVTQLVMIIFILATAKGYL